MNDSGFIVKSETATSVRHAFIEENNGRLIMNDIGEGQVALVPAGLVHFVQNMGCSPATFLAAFSSEDPGVLTTTTQACVEETNNYTSTPFSGRKIQSELTFVACNSCLPG